MPGALKKRLGKVLKINFPIFDSAYSRRVAEFNDSEVSANALRGDFHICPITGLFASPTTALPNKLAVTVPTR